MSTPQDNNGGNNERRVFSVSLSISILITLYISFQKELQQRLKNPPDPSFIQTVAARLIPPPATLTSAPTRHHEILMEHLTHLFTPGRRTLSTSITVPVTTPSFSVTATTSIPPPTTTVSTALSTSSAIDDPPPTASTVASSTTEQPTQVVTTVAPPAPPLKRIQGIVFLYEVVEIYFNDNTFVVATNIHQFYNYLRHYSPTEILCVNSYNCLNTRQFTVDTPDIEYWENNDWLNFLLKCNEVSFSLYSLYLYYYVLFIAFMYWTILGYYYE